MMITWTISIVQKKIVAIATEKMPIITFDPYRESGPYKDSWAWQKMKIFSYTTDGSRVLRLVITVLLITSIAE